MSGHQLSKSGNHYVMWHVTCDMSPVECNTWDVEHSLKISGACCVLSNGLKDYLFWRLPYNHMLYPISLHFHFVEIFNPYPDWVTFYLVFSFGQHLLGWEGLLPFALWKLPSYNPLQNALIQNALFKKDIINKSLLSSSIGGHFKRAKLKCPFALEKMPFYIPWQNALIEKFPFKKGHFVKGYRRAIWELWLGIEWGSSGCCWVLTVRLLDFHIHTVRLFGSQTIILLECLNVRQSYANNLILSDCQFFSL